MKELELSIGELETPSKNELLIQALQELKLKIIRDYRLRAKNKKQIKQLEAKELVVAELIQEIEEQITLEQILNQNK